ncbi:cytochrome bd-type quinol oxidase subunit 1 [Arthrobacter woluwensis]|uniref:hypothetical protein n=1 Tax=Arthrobacter woluwensis TaxID=156980 RepID=UPI002787B1F9|nr:hypothetical protein [Arthrobacter woluwensis]MDQ0708548.1 cytochrome bd-type quinol oxidase subunit 1 [Arthrobacter woluwensis]
MQESPNPLVPNGWEVGAVVIGAVIVVLAIVAWVLLLLRKPLTPAYRLVLALAVLMFPVLGPLAAILISLRAPRPGQAPVAGRQD